MTEKQPPKIAAYLISVALAVCFLGFYASVAYFTHLSRTAPTEPNLETGQSISLNNHGHVVYVRLIEAVAANSGFAFVAAAFAIFGVVRWTYPNSSFDSPPWNAPIVRIVSWGVMLATVIYMFWPR